VKTISATSARAIPTPRFDEGYARLPGAGYAALHPELEGINPEDYPDLTKLRILADVAPYSREYNRIRAVVEKQSRGDAELRADYEQIVDQVRQTKDSTLQVDQRRFDAPDVKSVSPVVNANSVTLTYNGTTYEPSSFVGTTPAYQEARNYTMAQGSWFTSAQNAGHSRVAVIGPTVVSELFGGQDPVGQTIQVNGTNFEVIGVTASKGSNGTSNQDDVVIAPLTAVQDTLAGYGGLSQIIVRANSRGVLNAAQTEVTDILDQRHPTTGSSTSSSFQVINQGSILQTSQASSKVFTTLLGEVAAISLLVGGIGVMNIMLVSVTERTREIGIRKAVGARRSDILKQFLVEAVLVSLLGGIAGVIAGIIGSNFKIAGVQPVIAPYSIALAFGAAVLTGLFFGTYPASRAAAMRPIDALRFE